MKSLTLLAFLSFISCFCSAEKIQDSEWNTGILIDQSPQDMPWLWREARLTDPDGHLLEYLAMLADTPRPDIGVVPYSVWQASVS